LKFDVAMKYKGQRVECLAEETMVEKVVSGSQDKVICPDTFSVCRPGAMCPKDCSNNGRCKMDGKCWCFPDFTGEDCSEINPKPYRMMVLDWAAGSLSLLSVVAFNILTFLTN